MDLRKHRSLQRWTDACLLQIRRLNPQNVASMKYQEAVAYSSTIAASHGSSDAIAA